MCDKTTIRLNCSPITENNLMADFMLRIILFRYNVN
jgi:hypothetical protein